jgi:hypothetical protein
MTQLQDEEDEELDKLDKQISATTKKIEECMYQY